MKEFFKLSPGNSESHPHLFFKLIFWFSNIYQRKEAADYIVEMLHFPNPETLVVIVSLQIPGNGVS